MTMIHCKDCKYAVPVLFRHHDGVVKLMAYECHFNSPGERGWPKVEVTDFCGDAELKDAE